MIITKTLSHGGGSAASAGGAAIADEAAHLPAAVAQAVVGAVVEAHRQALAALPVGVPVLPDHRAGGVQDAVGAGRALGRPRPRRHPDDRNPIRVPKI